jgi:hypothetical protein
MKWMIFKFSSLGVGAWLLGFFALLERPFVPSWPISGSSHTGILIFRWEAVVTITILFTLIAILEFLTGRLREEWKPALISFACAAGCALPISIVKIFI